MKEGQKLVNAFQWIDDEYLELVETQKTKKKKSRGKIYALIGGMAAVAFVCVMLVSNTGLNASEWFGLKKLVLNDSTKEHSETNQGVESVIAERETGVTDENVVQSEVVDSDLVEDDVDNISLAGFMDSPESKALSEWQEFLHSYDPDQSILWASDANPPALDDRYSLYFVYSQEMADKLSEITTRYNLKLHSQLDIVCIRELEERVGGPICSDKISLESGYIYEDGSFQVDGDYYISDSGESIVQIRRVVKGTFDETTLNVTDVEIYEEWQYQTADGSLVLLALGPGKGLVFVDCDSCFITVNVLKGTDTGLTKEKLEELAEVIHIPVLTDVKVPEMKGDVWE